MTEQCNPTSNKHQQTPTSYGVSASQKSLVMLMVMDIMPTPTVSTDISFPSQATIQLSTVQSVTAPIQQPMVTFQQTPRVTNITPPICTNNVSSVHSPDPPEEGATNQSMALLSYATSVNSIHTPMPRERKVNATISIASQSSISLPPPPTVLETQNNKYATQAEVDFYIKKLNN